MERFIRTVRAHEMRSLLVFMLLVCSGCATSWPLYDQPLTRDQIRQDKRNTSSVAVAVKAAPETEFRQGWSIPPEEEWVRSDMVLLAVSTTWRATFISRSASAALSAFCRVMDAISSREEDVSSMDAAWDEEPSAND